ncbi:YtxH domain-containing protein [Yeosuana marina]|uniref:YtxH domain-containing protein n=1 Tax=Yeosuana marina TaxID=1565536 RepID=UPI0030EDC48A|tara:strand:+ start:3124 stop:3387 length:264 start_codon:yes stop_codon:yes gene_type:complete
MKSSNTILGLVAGLAVGATLGILLAPDKGEKTRKKIISKTGETKDKLKDSFDDFLDTVSEKYSSIKDQGEELLKKEKEEIKKKMKKA